MYLDSEFLPTVLLAPVAGSAVAITCSSRTTASARVNVGKGSSAGLSSSAPNVGP